MIDAGIQEGDLVPVDRQKRPVSGDIVAAQIDGEWTLKYYEKRGAKVRLLPANKKYPVLIPERELVIGGVVVGSVRKYEK